MLLGMIGVFLPSVAVEVGGVTVSHRATLSLYRAENNREAVRRWLAGYGRSESQRVGGAILAVLLPHTKGAVNDHLDDVSSAMSTLRDVHDDDVKTAGTVLTIVLWGFLALHVLAGGAVLRGLVRDRHTRGGLAFAMLLSVVIAVVGVVLYVGWTGAVFEVNDEIGHEVVGLAIGAYVSPAAAVGALVAVCALVVRQLRVKA
jgi:hypothetical protein